MKFAHNAKRSCMKPSNSSSDIYFRQFLSSMIASEHLPNVSSGDDTVSRPISAPLATLTQPTMALLSRHITLRIIADHDNRSVTDSIYRALPNVAMRHDAKKPAIITFLQVSCRKYMTLFIQFES